MEVLIGVDPHKRRPTRSPQKATNSVAAIDESGELLEHASFSSSRHGLRALRAWAKRFEKRRWAVEGASGLGRAVAQYLVANGEGVVDVPAKLSARVRLLSTGGGRKSDRLDAVTPPSPLRRANNACARSTRRTWWRFCACSPSGATTW